MSRPILVTGSHRSGTTWVGKTLALPRQIGYIHEPFNPRRTPGFTGDRIPYWFLYVTPGNERFYRSVVEDVLAFRYPALRNLASIRGPRSAGIVAQDLPRAVVNRVVRARPLIKDPVALFSAEWLADRFDAQVVVMIRHPAAFVASIKKLDWQFRFRGWLAQPQLVADWLSPFERDMREGWDADIVFQGIVMWNAIHHVIGELRDRRPDWTFVRHEDLSRDPVAGFTDLYARLDIPWSERVVRSILESTGQSNPGEVPAWRHQSVKRDSLAATTTWARRLSPQEIDRVRAGTSAIASRFYDESDWDVTTTS